MKMKDCARVSLQCAVQCRKTELFCTTRTCPALVYLGFLVDGFEVPPFSEAHFAVGLSDEETVI